MIARIISIAALLVLTACGSSVHSSGGASTAFSRCVTRNLTITHNAGSGAAGSVYYNLKFKNIGVQICTLSGYPGVSAEVNGTTAGAPADRVAPFGSVVTLAPGATARAQLQIIDVFNYPSAICKPVTATGLKVYPPDAVTSKLVPLNLSACTTKQVFMYVKPVA